MDDRADDNVADPVDDPLAEGAPARLLQVAVPRPLPEPLDYLPPSPGIAERVVGRRIDVPLGKGRAVGVVVGVAARTAVAQGRLRRAHGWLDEVPLFDRELLETLRWAAGYYRYPFGEVLSAALPGGLRRGAPAGAQETWWSLSAAARVEGPLLPQAPRQEALRQRLLSVGGAAPATELLAEQPAWQRAARELERRGYLQREQRTVGPLSGSVTASSSLSAPPALAPSPNIPDVPGDSPPPLDEAQRQALTAIQAAVGFHTFLLDGVTGSGKTEVYLQAAARVLARGQQVLLLVPEIGLAPQLLERVRARLPGRVVVLHSGLAEGERTAAWLAARAGEAAVVVGTRSAVLTPLPRLGLIVVDEEHDPSLSQQEGFRYSGRDLAVVRARAHAVPIVLGSATPSLETLHNAQRQRYTRLVLPQRAGTARAPSIQVIDIRSRPLTGGLSAPLRQALSRHLEAGQQAMIFLNRRGYAPVLICHACGWVAECRHCDARLTVHRARGRMRCHHCEYERPLPSACPECGGTQLLPLGPGTERLEEALRESFPHVSQVRIDRDTTRRRGALEAALARAHCGEAQLLIGTQMLAKGHHLPELTLVAIIDVDQGLFGADFRAPERLAQLIVQVAGRAGRGEQAGEVVLQTRHPEHPLLRTLLEHGYGAFAEAHLQERSAAGLPPFAALALLRAEAREASVAERFLVEAREQGERLLGAADSGSTADVELLGPIPAPMPRREGRQRVQLLLRAEQRAPLQAFLGVWSPQLAKLKGVRAVRWSLDVDPVDLF
ncbi:primosomal protein N' [Halorhodospira abdelmalekii]|uniref:primosomal protein N' n=1 Tax=Halorhodospira abdelmalekii TaxID=421629 RepID=UPI00190748AA|nr:primosomal protein N' [Halorhodospira abdelmalekii]MBK1735926.1 primosomal protein N' [Halorhodospira abdelmalekii]